MSFRDSAITYEIGIGRQASPICSGAGTRRQRVNGRRDEPPVSPTAMSWGIPAVSAAGSGVLRYWREALPPWFPACTFWALRQEVATARLCALLQELISPHVKCPSPSWVHAAPSLDGRLQMRSRQRRQSQCPVARRDHRDSHGDRNHVRFSSSPNKR